MPVEREYKHYAAIIATPPPVENTAEMNKVLLIQWTVRQHWSLPMEEIMPFSDPLTCVFTDLCPLLSLNVDDTDWKRSKMIDEQKRVKVLAVHGPLKKEPVSKTIHIRMVQWVPVNLLSTYPMDVASRGILRWAIRKKLIVDA